MTTHTCTYRVIYGDTDQMGVVYYANYFRMFELGRCEFMRAAGLDYAGVERSGTLVPVIEANCRYRLPARFQDELEIETTLIELGRVRFTFAYRILRRDADGVPQLLVEGTTQHACMRQDGRPTRIPRPLREALEAPVQEQ